MKNLKLFALAAVAALMVSCGGSKPYDEAKVKELSEKVFSLEASDFPEVVKQVDGLLTYFEQNYTPEQLKENNLKVMNGEDGFGEETELYKTMNQFDSALYNQEDKMDEATKAAYKKYQEHRDKVRGF